MRKHPTSLSTAFGGVVGGGSRRVASTTPTSLTPETVLCHNSASSGSSSAGVVSVGARSSGPFHTTLVCAAPTPPPRPKSSKPPPPPPLTSSSGSAAAAANAATTGKPKTPPRLPGASPTSGGGSSSATASNPWGASSSTGGSFSEGFGSGGGSATDTPFGGGGNQRFKAGFGSAENTVNTRFSRGNSKSWGLAEKALGGFKSAGKDNNHKGGSWGRGGGGGGRGGNGRKTFNPSWKHKYMDADDDTGARGGSGGDGTALSAKAILYQLQHTMDQFKKVFGKEHVMVECSPLRRPFVLGYVTWAWQNNIDIIFDQKSSSLKKKEGGGGGSLSSNGRGGVPYQPQLSTTNPENDIDENLLPPADANNFAMKKAMVATLRMLTNGGELNPEQGLAAFKAHCSSDETFKKIMEVMDSLDLSIRLSFHLSREGGGGGGAQEWRIHCKVHLLDPYSASGSLNHETVEEEIQRRDDEAHHQLGEEIPGAHGYAVCTRTLGTSSLAAPQGLYRLLMKALNEHLVPYITEAAAYGRAESAHEAELMLKSLGRGGFGGYQPHLAHEEGPDEATDTSFRNASTPKEFGGFNFAHSQYDRPEDLIGSYAAGSTFLGRNSLTRPEMLGKSSAFGSSSIEGCGLGGLDKVKLVAVRRNLFPVATVPAEVQHPLEGSTASEMSLIVGFRLKYLDVNGNVTSLHYVNTSPLMMSNTLMQSLFLNYEGGGEVEEEGSLDDDSSQNDGSDNYNGGFSNGRHRNHSANRHNQNQRQENNKRRAAIDPIVYPALSEDALYTIGWHPSQLPPMHHDEVDLVTSHLRLEALHEAIMAFCKEPHLALSVRESIPPTSLLCFKRGKDAQSSSSTAASPLVPLFQLYPDYGAKLLPYMGADATVSFATQHWLEVHYDAQRIHHNEQLRLLGVENVPELDPSTFLGSWSASSGSVVDRCDLGDIACVKQTYESCHLMVPERGAPYPHLYTTELQRLASHRYGPDWLPPHNFDRGNGLGYSYNVTTPSEGDASGTGSGYSLFLQFASLGITPNSTTLQLSQPCLLHSDRTVYTVRSVIGLHGAGVSDTRARAHVKKVRIENRSYDESFDKYMARVWEGLRASTSSSSSQHNHNRRGGRNHTSGSSGVADIPGYMVAEASIMWAALNSANFDADRREAIANLTTNADVVVVEPALQSQYMRPLGRSLLPANIITVTPVQSESTESKELSSYLNATATSALLTTSYTGGEVEVPVDASKQSVPPTATYAAIDFKGIHNFFATSFPSANDNWSGMYSPARRGLILASLSSPRMGIGASSETGGFQTPGAVKTGGATVSVVNLKACLDATGCTFQYDARRDLYILRGSAAAREQQRKATLAASVEEDAAASSSTGGGVDTRMDVDGEDDLDTFGGNVELFAGRTLNGLTAVLVQMMGVQTVSDLPVHTFVYSSKKKKRKMFGRVADDPSQARKAESGPEILNKSPTNENGTTATDGTAAATTTTSTSPEAKDASPSSEPTTAASNDDEMEDVVHFTTRHLFKCASKAVTGEEVMLVQANIHSSPKLRSRSGIVNVLATTFGSQDGEPSSQSTHSDTDSDTAVLLQQSASKRVVQVGVQQAVKMALGDVDAPQELGQAIIVCGYSEEHSIEHVFKEAYERFILPLCVGSLPLHLLNQINPSLVETEEGGSADAVGRRSKSDDFFDGLSLVANSYAGRPCKFLEHPTTSELPLLTVQREELVEVTVEVPVEELDEAELEEMAAAAAADVNPTATTAPPETVEEASVVPASTSSSGRTTKVAPPLPLPAKPSAMVKYASKQQTKLLRKWITVAHQVHPETLLGTYFFLHDRCPTTTQDLINLKVGVDITPRTIPHFLTFRSLMKRLLGPKGFPNYHPSRTNLGQADTEISTRSHRPYCNWEVAVNNSTRGRVTMCTSLWDECLGMSPDSEDQDRSRQHGELGKEWPLLKGELSSILHETSLIPERHISKTVVAEVAAMKMLLKHFPTTYEAVFSFNNIGSIIFSQTTCDAFGWDDPAFHFGRSRQATNQVTCTFSGTNLKRADMVAAAAANRKSGGNGKTGAFTLTATAPNYFKALTRCVDSLLAHIGTTFPGALAETLNTTGTEAGILGSSASHIAAGANNNVQSNVMQSLSAGVQASAGGVIMGNYTPGDEFSSAMRESFAALQDNVQQRKRAAAAAAAVTLPVHDAPSTSASTPSASSFSVPPLPPTNKAPRAATPSPNTRIASAAAPAAEDLSSVDLQATSEAIPFIKRSPRRQPSSSQSPVMQEMDADEGAVMDLQASRPTAGDDHDHDNDNYNTPSTDDSDDAMLAANPSLSSNHVSHDEDPDLQDLPIMRNDALPHEDEDAGVWGVDDEEESASNTASGSVRFGGIGAGNNSLRTPIGGLRNVMNDEDDEEAALAFGGVGSALSYQQLSNAAGNGGRNSPGGMDELVPLMDQLHFTLMELFRNCLSFHTTIAPSPDQPGMFDIALVGVTTEDAEETIRTATCNGEGILIAIFELYESGIGVDKYRKIVNDLNRRAARHRSLEGSMFKIRRYITKQVRLSDNDIQFNHSDRVGWTATLTLSLAAFGFLSSQVGTSSISVSSSVKRTKKDASNEVVEKLVEATSVDIRSQAGEVAKGGTLGASSGAGSGGSLIRAAPGTTPQTRTPGFLLSPARKYPSLIDAAVHIASGRMRRQFPNASLLLRVVNDELEESMSDRQVIIAKKKLDRGGEFEPAGTELYVYNPDATSEEQKLQVLWRSPEVSLLAILQAYITVADYYAKEHDRSILDVLNQHRRHWPPASAGSRSTSTAIQANQLALKRYFGWNIVSEGENVVISRSLSISIGNPNTSDSDPFMSSSVIPSSLPSASNASPTQLGETSFDDEFAAAPTPEDDEDESSQSSSSGSSKISMKKDPKLARMLEWADLPEKWWTTLYDMPRWHCYFCIGGTPIATANGAKKKDAFFAASASGSTGLYEQSDLRLPEAEWLLKPTIIMKKSNLCGLAADGRQEDATSDASLGGVGGSSSSTSNYQSKSRFGSGLSAGSSDGDETTPVDTTGLPEELVEGVERQRQRFKWKLNQRQKQQESQDRGSRFHKLGSSTPRPSLL